MAGLALVADRPLHGYERFLAEMMNALDEHRVGGIALVAVLDKPAANGGDSMVGYHCMSLRDRQLAVSLLQADITYKIAQDAVRDMLDLPDPEEEEF